MRLNYICNMLKTLVLEGDKKQLFSNIYYLGLLQGVNYLLPLLTLPYLSRILGPSNIGIIAFSGAIIAYFILITDFGFNLSATRQVSINRNNIYEVNNIFSSVLIIKTGLMILCFLFLILLNLLLKWDVLEFHVFLITFGMVVGRVIDMFWVFQGYEKMKYITYLNIISRLFFTFGVFVFVNSKSDLLVVPILTSLGYIFSGIISLYLVYTKLKIRFVLQPIKSIIFQIKEGWHLFLSTVISSFYTTSSTIILGIFTNSTTVGYYSSADKIIQAAKSIYTPISQAIFPFLSKRLHENQDNGLKVVKKLTSYVGGLMFIISLTIFVFSGIIVEKLLGSEFHKSVIVLRIMSFLPFIVSVGNSLGVQTLLNIGKKVLYTKILFFAALIGLLLNFILVPVYEEIGTSITLIVAEIFVTGSMFYFLRSKIFI